MSDVLREQKKWVTRRYSEFYDAPNGGLNKWRNAIFFGELINSYYDPGFIDYIFTQKIAGALPKNKKCMIADFASGNGYVAKTVVEQLGRTKDRRVIPLGIDSFDKDFWPERPAPRIRTTQGNLLHLHSHFAPNFFDAGILRFALPFIRKELQQEALKQICNVLKPGAVLVVLNDGVFNKTKKDKSWNALFAECATYEGLTNMHYPSCESLVDMARIAGFDVKAATDLTDIAFGYLSPQICAEAYKLNSNKRKELEEVFKKWKQKGVLPFEPEPDSLRVPWPMYTCVLQKKGIAPSP